MVLLHGALHLLAEPRHQPRLHSDLVCGPTEIDRINAIANTAHLYLQRVRLPLQPRDEIGHAS